LKRGCTAQPKANSNNPAPRKTAVLRIAGSRVSETLSVFILFFYSK
jgi:hypothetical protein